MATPYRSTPASPPAPSCRQPPSRVWRWRCGLARACHADDADSTRTAGRLGAGRRGAGDEPLRADLLGVGDIVDRQRGDDHEAVIEIGIEPVHPYRRVAAA